MLQGLPDRMRQSLTMDNGTEFAKHHLLKQEIGIETFFCDIKAPWQKGGFENAIGRLRREIPRKTNLNNINEKEFQKMINKHNQTPRKSLDYKTPYEVFIKNIKPLHFKRESIFPFSRE